MVRVRELAAVVFLSLSTCSPLTSASFSCPQSMKAVQVNAWGAPDVLETRDVPTPKPSAGQVLVKVRSPSSPPLPSLVRLPAFAGLSLAAKIQRAPSAPIVPQVLAAGVNPVETYIRAGTYSSRRLPPFPWSVYGSTPAALPLSLFLALAVPQAKARARGRLIPPPRSCTRCPACAVPHRTPGNDGAGVVQRR